MQAPENENLRCIFCRKSGTDDPENVLTADHVIPEVLGGWITINVVCRKCNNAILGAQIESSLKKNIFIATALEKLGLATPKEAYRHAELALKLQSGKTVLAQYDSNGTINVTPKKLEDGSLFIPQAQSLSVLKKQAERIKRDSGNATSFDWNSFNQIPLNTLTHIEGTGLSFIKRPDEGNILTISGLDQPVPHRVPSKIAFEHLLLATNLSFIREERVRSNQKMDCLTRRSVKSICVSSFLH